MMTTSLDPSIEKEILTPEATAFLTRLGQKFEDRRQELLKARTDLQKAIDGGKMPDFLPETKKIREGSWKIDPIPKDLRERAVEITGPTDRKMVINALNSGANVFMADFEDSNAPTWANMVEGQLNLRDAVRQTISFRSPQGKDYRLGEKTATLLVRPRGWHLDEKHFSVDKKPLSGSLFDFGLYFFHNVRERLKQGKGIYLYLPKLESHLEARLWNDVFLFSEEALSVPVGTIKATVLIETILAAFEMDEILYELRQHSSGLNCGRWDYIFSVIKKFSKNPKFVLPDRAQVTMTTHFLRSYSRLVIQTCHRRGAHAMGGMAPQIPIKNDPQANEQAIQKVRQDKEREVGDGHDGTWVAHPGLVPVAKEVFDKGMAGSDQLDKKLESLKVTASDLLKVPEGQITEKGLRSNLSIGVQYLAAWLSGNGCVPLYNLMEDAATAEISRAQVWQWVRHESILENGTKISKPLVQKWLAEELGKIKKSVGKEAFQTGRYGQAAELMKSLITAPEFEAFLTIPAYRLLDEGLVR